jgi:CheY-like chemotaxis protein
MKIEDLKVMLVEDNAQDVFLTRKVLKHNGLGKRMVLAGDGEQALLFLTENAASSSTMPDLILLDIDLPVMGGIELLRRIKQDERFSSIPVVMLTGSNIDSYIQHSYDLGASTYLVKPISTESLLLVLNTLFSFT